MSHEVSQIFKMGSEMYYPVFNLVYLAASSDLIRFDSATSGKVT